MTIPKELRERFGLRQDTEVEFRAIKGAIVLRKKQKKLNLDKWKGHCKKSFTKLDYDSVDDFIEDIRGR